MPTKTVITGNNDLSDEEEEEERGDVSSIHTLIKADAPLVAGVGVGVGVEAGVATSYQQFLRKRDDAIIAKGNETSFRFALGMKTNVWSAVAILGSLQSLTQALTYSLSKDFHENFPDLYALVGHEVIDGKDHVSVGWPVFHTGTDVMKV